MTTVVTSFSNNGAHSYGYRFLDTFAEFWPADVKLIAYVEAGETHPRAETRDLLAVKALRDFLAAHADDPKACGRVPTPVWKSKDVIAGYSYRTDAVKFCRKVFTIREAALWCDDDILVWIDADVVTHRPIPDGFVEGLLGDDDIAYLGRRASHSECGFLAFRLPEAYRLIKDWRDFYVTGEAFALPEQHDSYLFDRARERNPHTRCLDLTPDGAGHVWMTSPLGRAGLDHLKGDRKALGRSPEFAA